MRTIVILFAVLIMMGCGEKDSTPSGIIELSTTSVTQIQLTTAFSGGEITSDGGLPILSRGVCWDIQDAPTVELSTKTTDGAGTGSFESELTGLSTNTYFVRAYATNERGTTYGNAVSFSIDSDITILTTAPVTDLTGTSAQSGGEIILSGHPVTERGVCWSTTPNPTASLVTHTADGPGLGSFISAITGIVPWTTYFIRAYAVTSAGTFYGDQVTIHSIPPRVFGTVSDIDGNNYRTIDIGNMIWMADNLKTTRFQDGTAINNSLGTGVPGYGAYQNNASHAEVYGYLYNGFAISDAKKVCPSGWHIPSVAEWNQLGSLLGGLSAAGGRMKSTSSNWSSPNTGADNSSGFSALPGGSYIYSAAIFADRGNDGYFWSRQTGTFYYVSYDRAAMRTLSVATDQDGLSVRCVKDP